MALIVGLMLLLIMTILGIAAMRGTFQQERMSANNQQQTVTFQGAEAAIRSVMDELRAVMPSPSGTTQSILITALNNGTSPTSTQLANTQRTATTGNSTTNSATMIFVGTSPMAGFRMGVDSASYVAYNFMINATSTQANTSASSTHQQGIARVGPSPTQ